MAGAVTVRIDAREVSRALRRLYYGRGGDAALARVVNRVAFDVLEAEGLESERVFRFAGPRPRSFIKRGFFFTPARPESLTATIQAKPGANRLLYEHTAGSEILPSRDRLTLGDESLAVPVGVKRRATGKVLAAQTPAKLLASMKRRRRTTRVFVNQAGTALLEAVHGSIRFLYALVPRARLEPRFEFVPVVERTAAKKFPAKVAQELAKLASNRT